MRNVVASVASVEAEPLLGQSFLAKLSRWIIDNNKHALIINDETTSMPQRSPSTALQSKTSPRPEINKPPAKIPPANALEASDFRWMQSCESSGYPSAYSFVLRNKTRQDILGVTYVVIFYGNEGTPIESVQGQLQKTIMAGLAKTLNSDLGGDAPYPGHEICKSARRIEVRIMDYETSGSQ
jgi:hypothetical protein